MYSHYSQIYKDTFVFFQEFQKELQVSESHVRAVMLMDKAFGEYLDVLTRVLEEETCARTVMELSDATKKLQYGLLSGMMLGVTLGFWTKEQTDESLIAVMNFIRGQLQAYQNRKTVLVITIRAGHGHTSAAKALVQGMWRKYGYDHVVVLKEIAVDVNTFYETTVKHTPSVYQWLFETTNSKEGMAIVHGFGYPMFARKLDTLLEQYDPDLIVSTYSFPGISTWISRSLREQQKYVPYIAVITDSISIHEMWYGKHIDHYVVANNETKQSVLMRGYDESKVELLGFPVDPRFYDVYDTSQLRAKKNIPNDKIVFLYSVGTGASMKDAKFIYDFDKKFGDVARLVVILGHNTQLMKKLRKVDLGQSVHVFGWVNDMYAFMQLADVVITKAGGATVMECIAAKKPMIITKVLPGQEQGNAELIQKFHLGVVMEKGMSLEDAIANMLGRIQANSLETEGFEKASIPQGTYQICDFLVKLLAK